MALSAGDVVMGGETQETRDTSNASGAGEVVSLASGGTVATADSEANDFGGVVSANEDTVVLGGAVVAAADGVSEGERVGIGNATGTTTGAFITDSGGPGRALSDTGGVWHGPDGTYDVPADHAVVFF